MKIISLSLVYGGIEGGGRNGQGDEGQGLCEEVLSYQLCNGCMVDQLVGQYMAHICSLGIDRLKVGEAGIKCKGSVISAGETRTFSLN